VTAKTRGVLLTYLKSIERAVVFDGQHVVVDGEDVAVRRKQVRQMKCFRLITHRSQCHVIRSISENVQVQLYTC